MRIESLDHLSDSVLLRNTVALNSDDQLTNARLLAHLAEVDARKLYLPEGYPSMYSWCVGALRMTEDVALLRIRVARTARQYPSIYGLLADGRLGLTSVLRLAPHLSPAKAGELIHAAAGKSKAELEALLAERFPRTELLPMVHGLSGCAPAAADSLVPEPVGGGSLGLLAAPVPSAELVPEPVAAHSPDRNATRIPRSRVAPIAAQRYALQVTIGQGAHEKLGYAQALLGHALPSGDLGAVIERALDALIVQLEKRKFGATSKPHRQTRRASSNPRHIPAAIKRAVWERDGGRCTFKSESGHRCEARDRIEFDHVEAVARGGVASVEGIRLRCRAHNQYEAECAFGVGFMDRKRRAAMEARAEMEARSHAAEIARGAAARARAATEEVVPYLRALGLGAEEAWSLATACEAIPDASLEARVRCALSTHGEQQRQRHARILGATT